MSRSPRRRRPQPAHRGDTTVRCVWGDTSIWIDHLHCSEAGLVALLANDDVGCHAAVIEEPALGSLCVEQ